MIETHPELGERILAPIEQLEHVRPIVRACHERYDGDGYPDGLLGDEIPLEARIIFVCDAFHAMTTTRPYREALPVDEARRRLLEGCRLAVRSRDRRGLPPRAPRARGRLRRASLLGFERAQATRRSSSSERPSTSTSARTGTSQAPGSSPGSAVESSSAHRRPKRTGGSLKVSGSRHALKMHEERVVDDVLALTRLGHDLGPVQERADRGCVAALPVLARHRASVGPEPPDVGCPRVLLLEPRQERRPPEDRVVAPQRDRAGA